MAEIKSKFAGGLPVPWYQRVSWSAVESKELNHEMIKQAFAQISMHDKDCFYISNYYGTSCRNYRDLLNYIESIPGVVKITEYIVNHTDNNYQNLGYFWDDGAFCCTIWSTKEDPNYVNANGDAFAVGTNEKQIREIIAKTDTHFFKTTVPQGRVYVMTPSESGLKLTEVGMAAVPLERDNYDPKVVEDFDFVVKQLQRKDPVGNIVIFHGVPGSGKTFSVRAMLSEIKNSIFVVVPINIAASLGDPGIIKLLMDTQKKHSLPIYLVVEDADAIIANRGPDNMSAISTLLNMTDGILGKLLDIRIVCTTNADYDDLDPAITRPGRLLKEIHVNGVGREQAHKIYHRLTGGDKKIPDSLKKNQDYTLAEIYVLARPDLSVEEARLVPKKVGMGFAARESDYDEDHEALDG